MNKFLMLKLFYTKLTVRTLSLAESPTDQQSGPLPCVLGVASDALAPEEGYYRCRSWASYVGEVNVCSSLEVGVKLDRLRKDLSPPLLLLLPPPPHNHVFGGGIGLFQWDSGGRAL